VVAAGSSLDRQKIAAIPANLHSDVGKASLGLTIPEPFLQHAGEVNE